MLIKFNRAIAQLSYLPRTFHLVWTASRYWTIAWMLLLVVQGVLPAATVYLTRWVVNSLVAAVGAGVSGDNIQKVLIPVMLMVGVLLLGEVLGSAGEWIRTAQSELVQDHTSGLVHYQSMTIDLSCYESPEYHDHLNRARSGASERSLALLENAGNLLQNSITLLTMAAVILPYGVWLPFFLLFSALPAFYVVLRLNRRYHRWWQRTTIDRRWLDYYETLLTDSSMAAEMRLLNLGSYFRSAYQKLRYRLRNERLKLVREQTLGRLVAGVITLCITGLALAWMGRQVLLGIISLGDLALFYQAFRQGQGLIRSLLSSLGANVQKCFVY